MVKQSNTKKTKVQTMKKDNSKSTDLKKDILNVYM